MKHTQGKWYIDSKDEHRAAKIKSTIHKEGQGICLVYPNKEWEANAILISEAPETKKQRDELLEVVKELVKRVSPEQLYNTPLWDKAKELITKSNES